MGNLSRFLNPRGIAVVGVSKDPGLHAAAVQALRAPDVAARLSAQGAEPVGSTPAEFGAFVRSEIIKWANLVKAANMKPE